MYDFFSPHSGISMTDMPSEAEPSKLASSGKAKKEEEQIGLGAELATSYTATVNRSSVVGDNNRNVFSFGNGQLPKVLFSAAPVVFVK